MRKSNQSRAALDLGLGSSCWMPPALGAAFLKCNLPTQAQGEVCVKHPEGKGTAEKDFAILPWQK